MSQRTIKSALIAYLLPQSTLADIYRAMRVKLQLTSRNEPIKTLMVTSPLRGDGKTTTASNLAIAYAQEGKRTLLIDGNFRSPSLHELFKTSNATGLADVLTTEKTWRAVIQGTEIRNLKIITTGVPSLNPLDMLSSEALDGLIREIASEFDTILFDSPSLLAANDGMVIASKCDGVLLVVSPGKTKKAMLLKMRQHLDDANAKVVGVVLNKIKRKKAI